MTTKLNFVYVSGPEHEVITTLTKDDIDYLLKLVHKETDNKGFWGSTEENILETLENIKKYFD